jgi:serine protease AprX
VRVLILSIFLTAGLGLVPTPVAAGSEKVPVIVRGSFGPASAGAAVDAAGGSVRLALPIVDGVAADVPSDALDELGSDPRVAGVAADAEVQMQHYGHEEKCKGKTGKALRRCKRRVHEAAAKAQRIQRVVNADKVWGEGNKGQGSTVAVLDTGIYSLHPDLGERVVHCEDFSGEFEGALAADAPVETKGGLCSDPFGHGSFMAGLIAGDGASSYGRYSGIAPKAEIVSIKVAGYDGSTDISKILAGIQWVVSHKDAHGIDVLNLSLGSDSAQDRGLSPLNYAVEEAWAAGIVVVVSAGNDGDDPQTMMKPGDDPWVITVGSSNDEGTVPVGDDKVPVFSSRGETRSQPGLGKPDVVSPGVHTVSLRSPGSAIDKKFGDVAAIGRHYFRGTGTSMSTATVSGIAALLLTADPSLTPDEVKCRLMESARPLADGPLAAGRGVVDAYGAIHLADCEGYEQEHPRGTGLGLLDADRGSVDVFLQTALEDPTEVPSVGECAALQDPSSEPLPTPLPSISLTPLPTPLPSISLTPLPTALPSLTPLPTALPSLTPLPTPLPSVSLLPTPSPLGVPLPTPLPSVSLPPLPLPPDDDSCDVLPWATIDFATTEWTPETWEASSWKEHDWAGTAWEASSWKATTWDASSWKGTGWNNVDWDASSWKGTDWDASSWKASSWKSSWYAAAWD